jgi:hypothetical protein
MRDHQPACERNRATLQVFGARSRPLFCDCVRGLFVFFL